MKSIRLTNILYREWVLLIYFLIICTSDFFDFSAPYSIKIERKINWLWLLFIMSYNNFFLSSIYFWNKIWVCICLYLRHVFFLFFFFVSVWILIQNNTHRFQTFRLNSLQWELHVIYIEILFTNEATINVFRKMKWVESMKYIQSAHV